MTLSQLSRSIEGSRAIVTGAGSGMGRATAHLLADLGVKVLVTDWDEVTTNAVAAEIQDAYGSDRALAVVADVSSNQDRRRLVDECVRAFGGIDILINNAGISRVSSIHSDDETFESNWDQTLAINVTAHAQLIRLCFAHLTQAPHGGRVVNIASSEAIVATGGLAAYTAAKHAVVGLTKSFAVELGPLNVTVNAICPGPIETGMTEAISDEKKARYAKRKVPLRRYGHPEEVAHMSVSMCLPAASFTNGAVLVVDGGMTINHA